MQHGRKLVAVRFACAGRHPFADPSRTSLIAALKTAALNLAAGALPARTARLTQAESFKGNLKASLAVNFRTLPPLLHWYSPFAGHLEVPWGTPRVISS